MSTIYLDPVAMDSTAGAISDHVADAEIVVADLETACSAQVPASLAGWLAEELRDVTAHVRMSALVYALAALDTALRAQQIQADQSLATAAPALTSTTTAFTGAPLAGGFLAGQVDTSSYVPTYGQAHGYLAGQVDTSSYVPTYGQAEGFMLGPSGPNTQLGGYTPVLGGFGSQVHWGWNSSIANDLAPKGLTAISPGIYEDLHGGQGTLNQTVRDPRTGNAEF